MKTFLDFFKEMALKQYKHLPTQRPERLGPPTESQKKDVILFQHPKTVRELERLLAGSPRSWVIVSASYFNREGEYYPGVIDAKLLKGEGINFDSNDIGFVAVPQEQEPMTAWMILHRFAHALSQGDLFNEFDKVNRILDNLNGELHKAQGMSRNYDLMRDHPAVDNMVIGKLFSFGSARSLFNGRLHLGAADLGELGHDLFVQYITKESQGGIDMKFDNQQVKTTTDDIFKHADYLDKQMAQRYGPSNSPPITRLTPEKYQNYLAPQRNKESIHLESYKTALQKVFKTLLDEATGKFWYS
jgi:hypothetical protein